MLAIGIKKLCRAQNVPGLVFALIASPCWQLASMLCGPCIGICPGIRRGAGAGICSHLFSRCPLCWHLHRHLVGIRVGIRCAGVRTGVCRAGVAGIHAGVCFAVMLAFARASVVLPFALASVVRQPML